MKRIGILLLGIMLAVVSYGQSKHVWQSQDYEEAQKKFDDVQAMYKKKGNKTWSLKLLEAFPIASDKTIKHQYVIKCDTTFSADIISNVLSAWCKIKFPDAVQSNVGSNENFRISGILKGVVQTFLLICTCQLNLRQEYLSTLLVLGRGLSTQLQGIVIRLFQTQNKRIHMPWHLLTAIIMAC